MISCQNCGHENRAESNFCSHCGTKLPHDVEAGEAAAPQAAEAPPDAPKELAGGRYVISRYLGEGGRKRVYLAHDTLLDRDVAVGLGKTSGLDPEARPRVAREARSDLYSLGAVIYEMVTGRPPFVGDDIVSVISQHQRAEPVKPSWHAAEVPQELEDLVMRLLAKKPEQRPQAQEIRERLREIEALPL